MPDEPILTKAELLKQIQRGWDELHAYLKPLNDVQLTGLKDAVGWTVKDHLAHLAAWEDSVYATLTHRSRAEYLGIDPDIWENSGFDAINAVLRKRYAALSMAETLRQLAETHDRLLQQIEALSDADLYKPFNHFDPKSTHSEPIIGWITGNTFEHYAEHLPWMTAIVEQKK